MNVYIKNNYTVEKVFIDFEDGIPSKIKDIIISSTDDYPIISDNINSYANTFVMSSTND